MTDLADEKYQSALIAAQDESKDLSSIAEMLTDAARLGSANAKYALGSWYFYGKLFSPDPKKALVLWKDAAQCGQVDACLELATVYERGEVVRKNLRKALIYNLMASILGAGQGDYELSRLFYYGIGVPKSRVIYEKLMDSADSRGFEDRA